ncbi:MAG: hypothetical protein RL139_990 [Gemmatimonadota bacterium]
MSRRPRPRTLLALVATVLAAWAPSVVAQTRPTPQALIARHDSLVGGRAAFEAHQAIRLTGTFGVPMIGLEGPLEILKLRPDRFLLRATLGPLGELLSGFDGRTGWSVQPGQGPRVMTGPEAAMLATQADFFADLHDLAQFSTVESLADTTFEGRPVVPVRLVRRTGETVTEFFDRETGLSAGSRVVVQGPQGEMEVIGVLADYRRFGAVQIPTRRIQRTAMLETVLTIRELVFDGIGPADVAPPPAVQALIRP